MRWNQGSWQLPPPWGSSGKCYAKHLPWWSWIVEAEASRQCYPTTPPFHLFTTTCKKLLKNMSCISLWWWQWPGSGIIWCLQLTSTLFYDKWWKPGLWCHGPSVLPWWDVFPECLLLCGCTIPSLLPVICFMLWIHTDFGIWSSSHFPSGPIPLLERGCTPNHCSSSNQEHSVETEYFLTS